MEQIPLYHLHSALNAVEQAQAINRDQAVGNHISRALNALWALQHQAMSVSASSGTAASDPYEMNEFNSAI